MFGFLTKSLSNVIDKISGRGILSNKELQTLRDEILKVLVNADVNLAVAQWTVEKIAEKFKALKVSSSIDVRSVILRSSFEVLKDLLGAEPRELKPKGKPPLKILFVGLQGSGKTTTVAKLGFFLKKKKKKDCLLVSVDKYRPAAFEQLEELASKAKLRVFRSPSQDPLETVKLALEEAKKIGSDAILVDSAGRTELNEALMMELTELKSALEPDEVLLVVDSMVGQAISSVAVKFDGCVGLTGIIATKADSDAKGGGILSVKWQTGKPVLFLGVGERIEDLEPFIPERFASRILGLGDIKTLIEHTNEIITPQDAQKVASKLESGSLTLDDFLDQLQSFEKIGSFSRFISLVPGLGQIANSIRDEEVLKKLKKIKAIILSMTKAERKDAKLLSDASRIRRITKGSGSSEDEVRQLVNQFKLMIELAPKLARVDPRSLLSQIGNFKF